MRHGCTDWRDRSAEGDAVRHRNRLYDSRLVDWTADVFRRSEREIAFMLDLANQHGDGGAKSIVQAAGPQLLGMENESVKRVAAQFGEGSNEVASTRARRTAFRTSTLLSDVTV